MACGFWLRWAERTDERQSTSSNNDKAIQFKSIITFDWLSFGKRFFRAFGRRQTIKGLTLMITEGGQNWIRRLISSRKTLTDFDLLSATCVKYNHYDYHHKNDDYHHWAEVVAITLAYSG